MTDPKAVDDAYARNCKDFKRYLAFDVALLASLEANHDDSRADQMAKKKKMLLRYRELCEVETSIPLFGASVLMGGLFLLNVLLGALSATVTTALPFVAMMFILSLVSGMPGLVGKIHSIFEEEEDMLVEEGALNQSNGRTAGVPRTAFEITEWDTRREAVKRP